MIGKRSWRYHLAYFIVMIPRIKIFPTGRAGLPNLVWKVFLLTTSAAEMFRIILRSHLPLPILKVPLFSEGNADPL